MRHFSAMLVWIVLACPAIAATPAERLLGPLLAEVTAHQPRCDWQAEQTRHLERSLSLYRNETTGLVAELDGVSLERRASVDAAVFETRLLGPTTATIALTSRQSAPKLRAGQRLAVQFVDRAGVNRPLFCGIVFTVRADPRSSRMSVSVVQPRVGRELVESREFTDMTRGEVVSLLAAESGVPIDVQDVRPGSTLASVRQQNLSNWTFMRRLATLDEMTLTLEPGGFLYADSAFRAPPSGSTVRTWTDMRWTDVVEQLAALAGLTSDVQENGSFPAASFRQDHEDLAFAHELAAGHERSAYLDGQRLLVRDDGVWRRDPSLVSQGWHEPLPGIAASIARRHGVRLVADVRDGRVLRMRQHHRRDSEFLLQTLADAGLHLETEKGALRLRRSRTPGDVADLVTLRAVVWYGDGRDFSRSHGGVRDQLLAPLEVPSTLALLRLPGRAGKLTSPATRSSASPPALLPDGWERSDLGASARELDQALNAARAAAQNDPRERFLLDLVQVYRPTVAFLHRVAGR